MLLAAEPTGRPDPVAGRRRRRASRPTRLRVWFPIRRGLLRKTVGHVKAVNDATVAIRAGETLGVVGECGLGQDHARPRDHAADLLRGPHRLSRPGHPGLEAPASSAACAATCRWCSRTPTARSRRACRSSRSSPRASVSTASATRQGRVAAILEEVGLDPVDGAPLPARILRRPAPAHRHRPRDDPAAEARRPRRADLARST